MRKKLLSILLALTLTAGILPAAAFAADSSPAEEAAEPVSAEEPAVQEEADVVPEPAAEEEAEPAQEAEGTEEGAVEEAPEAEEETEPEAAVLAEPEAVEGVDDALLGAEAPAVEREINEKTGRVIGLPGDEDVAVLVYGKSMADAINKSNYSFSDFEAALKSEVQGILANEKLPKVEMYLVNDNDEEYLLEKDAVKDAAFLSSFRFEADGILDWLDDIIKYLQDAFGWLISDISTSGQLYRIYGAKNVPEGNYTLEIRSIDGEGYTLWEPRHGFARVHVGDDHVNYVGYERVLGRKKLKIAGINLGEVTFSIPGVFLNTREPGFSFTSADLGGKALAGTEYVLINRDETVKIIKAAYSLGKDTFVNAMNLIGTDGFTWEELSILHNQVLQWDSEAQQISINGKQAYKLLTTYWALVQASATDPLIAFMSDETNIKLPAILKAKARSDGTVFFGEDNNVTLTWSLEILLRMGDVVLDSITEEDIKQVNFPDKQTESMVRLVLSLARYGASQGVDFWDSHGNLIPEIINDWVYPILQNDNMMKFAKNALIWAIGSDDLSEEDEKLLKLLPTHALLTKKMPAGYYMMIETGVPDGYIHTPLFYTIKLTWNTENRDPATWCYATVGNLGLVLPYFAEDYYTYLREFNAAAEADRILNLITEGKTGTMIEDIISNQTDVSGLMIAYYTNIIYNYLGGSRIYGSEAELAAELTKYLYAHGRTAQNLLIFGNQVAKTSKAVVTGKIDHSWKFYTATTSIRTNLALRTKAILLGVADSIDTTGGNKINTAFKQALLDLADRIDTTNHIIEQTTKIKNEVKEKVKSTATTVAKKSLDFAKNTIKTILTWSRIPQ